MAAAGWGGEVRLWDVHDRKTKKTLQAYRGIMQQSVAFAPDDRTLASADDLGIAHLWDTSSGAYETIATAHETIATGHNRIWCVAFSPDGRSLATTSQDATVRLWDMTRDRPRRALQGGGSSVTSIAFSADGTTLAVAVEKGTVWIFNAYHGRLIKSRPFHASTPTAFAALSRDASLLATAAENRTITIQDFPGGRPIQEFAASAWPLYKLSIAPGGRSIAMAGKDGRVVVRETASGTEKQFVAGDTNNIESCPRGDSLGISRRDQPRPTFCDFTTGQSHFGEGLAHRGGTNPLAFSPDGQTLATGGDDRTIILWDCRSLKEILCLFGHTDEVTSLGFSLCGRILASGGHDRTVRLWDIASQREIAILRGHSRTVRHITFSPDGLTLASCADSVEGEFEVFLWPATPGSKPSVAIRFGLAG